MRRLLLTFSVLILSALLALPALAQEAEAEAPQATGLGGFMLIGGLAALFALGVLLTQRESSSNDDDLV